jgi:predicted Zn-dependent protease
MHRRLPTSVLAIATCLSAWPRPAAGAEPASNSPFTAEAAAVADEVFEEFFAESDSERRRVDAVSVSAHEERRVGDQSLQQFLQSLQQQRVQVLRRGKDAAYLKALLADLHPLMRNADRYRAIRVYVAASTATDARSFPGGAIVCSTGLIDFARSEAALVGVLAHELSHIDRGHQLRMTRGIKLAQDAARVAHDPQDMVRRGMMLAKQFARPFRAEDEAAADGDAMKWMAELGYDPLEMAKLFRRLHERDGDDPLQMPAFLRTHPYFMERYLAVRDFTTTLRQNPDAALYIGRENLKKRTPRSAKRFDE